ncbi:hypothetical protein B0H66DRAFT_336449 [Apodospora peruviana]|uniref:Ubiquitin-like protease family profile domain-containing protein n=1 Tax=Apodospora peruviana TaxID=516989 RepID=A0AAE0HYF2_9PEZI|nr:hypothetical protein B0H66DRAFT_336449 [Apodospora peruviana]
MAAANSALPAFTAKGFFWHRRFGAIQEHVGDKFAKELFTALKNERYMRKCSCPLPAIFDSKESAERGRGHLRFYRVGDDREELGLLQKKGDLVWHCNCTNRYSLRFSQIVNQNGKRGAETDEVELLLQEAEARRTNEPKGQVSRIIAAPADTANAATSSTSAGQQVTAGRAFGPATPAPPPPPPPPPPMWAGLARLKTRGRTMGKTVANYFGSLYHGRQHDTVDIRRHDTATGAVVTKRQKRQTMPGTFPTDDPIPVEDSMDIDPIQPMPPATPQPLPRSKLAFESPVSKFLSPTNITNVPGEPIAREELAFVAHPPTAADVVLSDILDDEKLQKEDEKLDLSYHAHKYQGFINDMRTDVYTKYGATLIWPGPDNGIALSWPGTETGDPELDKPVPLFRKPPTQCVHRFDKPISDIQKERALNNHFRDPRIVEHEKHLFLTGPRQRDTRLDDQVSDEDMKRGTGFLPDVFQMSRMKRDEIDEIAIERQVKQEFHDYQCKLAEEERLRKLEQERKEREEAIKRHEEELRQKAEEERRQKEAEELRAKEEAEREQLGLRRPNRPVVSPMTDEWKARVANVQQANPATELVKTPDGNSLTRRDFAEKLLPATAWLNDNIINASLIHVGEFVNKAAGVDPKTNPKCAVMSSYFFPRLKNVGVNKCGRLMRNAGVRKENFLSIDSILIPICSDNHWTLAVVRPSKRHVSHIDSIQGGAGDADVKNLLMKWVEASLENDFVTQDWKMIDYVAPRQTNGWDCGVFTITNAICMALGVNPREAYGQGQLSLQRMRIAAMLLNKGFTNEMSLDGL